jgi:hypothetical protein
LVVEVDVRYKPLFKEVSFFFSTSVMMINPYSEYHRAYGGGADDHVERRGGTDDSSVCP